MCDEFVLTLLFFGSNLSEEETSILARCPLSVLCLQIEFSAYQKRIKLCSLCFISIRKMLRKGTTNDFDALYSIYMHPTVNPYLSFEIMDQQAFQPIFDEKLRSGTLYIYENDQGEIVATANVKKYERRCAHVRCITTFATNPNFARQGFGTKFMKALVDHLREDEEVKRIELFAEADNPIALGFYQKLGFQIEGCLKKYYKRANEDNFVDEFVLAMLF